MAEAVARLMELSAEEEMRMLAGEREEARRDQLARERYVRQEGEAKGRAEGEASKQVEIALRLLRMQMSQADVANTTGLSEADVKRLALEENL